MEKLKQKFLNQEIWIMSSMGAFRRVKIYQNDVGELKKKEFKNFINKLIEEYVNEKYKIRKVDDQEHCRNIEEICKKISSNWGDILKNCSFQIGVCQKLLNLYLKYLWCLELIEEPPHCPIDSTIISECESESLKKIKWTQIKDITTYKNVIAEIETKARRNNLTLANWELEHFSSKRPMTR